MESKMKTQSPPPIAVRGGRIRQAVALQQPDRVPFMPSLGNIYAMGYGLTVFDAMKHMKSVIPAMERLAARYDPDLLFVPDFFPIDVMEMAGAQNLRWPGAYWGLPPNTPYQYLDESFLQDDEWEEYLGDPTRFLLRKVLPRRYKALAGLGMLNVHGLCAQAPLALAGAGLPPVKQALQNLIDIASVTVNCIQEKTEICMRAVQLGYPIWGNFVAMAPFDEFADCIRGLLPTLMDLQTDPALVDQAVERWGEISIPAYVAQGKAMHAGYAMIPLHCGIDSFLSPHMYERHYWPGVKKLLLALIDAGITPIALCEGKYDTRLETIADIPGGKVIYSFEQVDMARAKGILGSTACIAGGMPTSLLIHGTRETVVEQTKRAIDLCGQGGGYIMSNSMSLDNADHALLEAWHETTITYGRY